MQSGDTAGAVSLSIAFSDAPGNAGTTVTAVTSGSAVTFYKTAPTLTAVTMASNNSDTTKAKVGDIITLTITSSADLQTPTVTIAGSAANESGSGTSWSATYAMQSGDTAGAVSFSIAFSDAPGNAGTTVTAVTSGSAVTFDKTAPSFTSVVVSDADEYYKTGDTITLDINLGEQELTVTADLSVLDSAYSSSQALTDDGDNTYSFTTAALASGTMVEGVDTAVTITATDAASNQTQDSTLTLTIDKTAPTGYSVSINQDPINDSNETAMSFTFASAEVGATYNYSVNDTNGATTAISGSGTVSTATDTISSINVSPLDDETLTLTVYLTDPAGNQGSNVTDTVTKDTGVPGLDTVTMVSNNSNTAYAKTGDMITLTIASSENIQTPTVTIAGSAANVSGSNSSWSATYTMQSGDTAGLLSFSVAYNDIGGNPGTTVTAVTSGSAVTFYKSAPTLSAVTMASNNSETTKAKIGDVVTLSITSSADLQTPTVTVAGHSVTPSGSASSWSATYAMVTGDSEGSISFSIAFTDIPGNAGTTVTAVTSGSAVTFDKTAPTGYSSTIDQLYVNAGNKTAISFSFTGAEVGASYNYSIDDTSGGTSSVTGSGTISTATDTISSINLSTLADDTLTLTVYLTDVVGNQGSNVTDTIVKDVITPSGYSVDIVPATVNNSNYTGVSFIFASGEVGTTYNYSIDDTNGGTSPVTGSGTVTSATDTISSINTSTLDDDTLTLTVYLTDAAGNQGSDKTDTVVKSVAIYDYTVSIDSPQTEGTGFTGTVTAYDVYDAVVSSDSSTVVTMTETGSAVFYTNSSYDTTTTTYTLSSGTVTIYIVDPVSESITVTATDGNSKTGTSSSISIGEVTATLSYSPDRAVRDADTLTITASFTASQALTPQISVNYAGSGSDVSSADMSGSGSTWTYAANIPSGNDGTATVSIANTGVSNATFTVDNTVPTFTSVSIDQAYVNDSNKTAMSFTFAGAETGTTYNYSIDDTSGGTSPVTGSGSVSTAADQISSINVSTLADDTLTLTVYITDEALNQSSSKTDTVFKDVIAPSGYTVNIGQSNITDSNKTAMSFTFADAEIGTTYTYSIDDTNGSTTAVTASSTISTATDTISSIDVSSLDDDTLTLTVYLTDIRGNQGSNVTDTVTKDAAVPTLDTVTMVSNNSNTAYAKTGDLITLSITASETITTPTVTIAGSAANVSGSGTSWSATYTMASGDTEGEVSFSIGSYSDGVGNAGSVVTSVTSGSAVTFYKTTPTLSTVAMSSNNSNTAYAKTGDLITLSITGSVNLAEPTVTIAGSAASVSGSGTSWSATYTMASGDTEGAVSFSIAFSDAPGNAGTTVTAVTSGSAVTFYKNAPTLSAVTMASNNSNTAYAKVGHIITLSITASADLATPTVTIAGSEANVSGSDASWSATYEMVSGDSEGSVSFSVAFSDAPGNAGTTVTAVTSGSAVTFDKTVPTFTSVSIDQSYINDSNKAAMSFTFAAAETGTTYTYSVDDTNGGTTAVTGTGSVSTATDTVSGINVTSLDDDTLTLTVYITDSAGNQSTSKTDTVTKDVVAPSGYSVSINQDPINDSNETALSFSFTSAVVGTTYNYSIDDTNGSTTAIAGSGSISTATDTISSINVSALDDDTLTLTVYLTDTAGNQGANATDTVTKSTGAPTLDTVTMVSNNSNTAYAKTGDLITLSITASESIQTPTVTIAGSAANVSGSGTSWSATYTMVSGDTAGLLSFSIAFSDSGGNPGTTVTAVTSGSAVTFYKTAPTLSAVTMASNNSNTAYAKVDDVITLSITSSADLQSPTVTIAGSAANVSGSGTSWSATYAMQSGDTAGLLSFSIAFSDAPGNAGTAVTAVTSGSAVTFYKTAPTLTAVTMASDNSNTAYAKVGHVITLSITASADLAEPTVTIAGSAANVSGSDTSWSATYEMVTGDTAGTVSFSIAFSDIPGNAGTAVTAVTSGSAVTFDKTVPTFTSVSINQAYINNSNKAAMSFTFAAAETGTTYTYSVDDTNGSTTAVTGTGSVSTATDTVSGINVTSLDDDTLTLTVYITDAASNQSTSKTDTVTKDVAAPSGYSVSINQDPINDSNETALSFSFTSAVVGTTYNYSIDDTNGSTTAIAGSGSISTATDTISSINVSALDDDTLTLTVYLTDTAGNQGADATDTVTKSTGAPTLDTVTMASNNSNTAYAKTGDIITLSITASENIQEPTVTIAGSAANVSGSNASWSATYAMQAGDSEGAVSLSIAFSDSGGNPGTTVTAVTSGSAVTFYKSTPTLSAVTMASNNSNTAYAKVGDVITLSITGSANLAEPTVTIAGSAANVSGSGTSWSATYTMASGDTEGSISFSIAFSDAPGNAGTAVTAVTSGSAVTFYKSTPTLSAVTMASNNSDTTVAKVDDIVTLSITGSANLASPTVTIAGSAANVSGSNASWSATYAMQSDDTEGAISFSIAFSDAPGNAGTTVTAVTSGSAVTFSKSAPTLSTVTMASDNSNTAYAKVGDVVTLSITGSTNLQSPTVTIAGSAASVSGSGTSWSATYAMQAGDSEGAVSLSIAFSDTAGNAGTAVTAVTQGSAVTFYKSTPTLSTVTMASNNSNTAYAKVDHIITLSITGSANLQEPTVTIAGSAANVSGSGTSWSATYTMVSGDSEGSVSFSIAFSDAPGNAGTAVTAVTSGSAVTFDKTVPTFTSVSIGQAYINDSNKAAMSFTFAAAETGTTYTYSVDDTNGSTTAVTGTGSVSTATDTVSSINVTSLDDDTLTLTVYITDAASNQSTSKTDTVTKDVAAPSGYSVSINQDPINDGNETALSFTFASAVVGTTYNYSIDDAGNGATTAISGSGTISTTTDTISNINVSSLDDGTLTLTVYLTDTAGNQGADATDTVSKSTGAPTLDAVTMVSNNSNTAYAKTADIITLSITASENIQTPTVTIAGSAANVSGSNTSWSATYAMQSGDTEGAVSFSIAFSDTSSNAGTEVTAVTSGSAVTFYKSTPTLSAVTMSSNNSNTAYAKTGDLITLSITGSANLASPTVTIAGSSANVSGSNASWSATYTMQAGDTEEAVSFSIAFSDAAGNAGTTVTAVTSGSAVTFYKTTPTLTAVTMASNNSNTAYAKVGDIITLSITGSANLATPTVTIAGNAANESGSGTSWSATYTMQSGDNAGSVSFSIAFSDASGNAGTTVTAVTSGSAVTFDKTAPALTSVSINQATITDANKTALSFTFSGAETASTTYYYSIDDANGATTAITGSGSVVTAGDTISNINVSSLDDGTLTLTAYVLDVASNQSTSRTDTVTKDASAPTLDTVTMASNNTNTAYAKVDHIITLSITSNENIQEPTVTIAGHLIDAAYVTGSNTSWSATYTMVSGDTAGAVSFSIAFSDTGGNAGTTVTSVTSGSAVTFDKTVPSGYSVSIDQSGINNGNQAALSFTFASAEVGAAYTYSIDDTNGGTNAITGSGTVSTATDQVTGINVNSLVDDTLTLTVSLTDPAGNQGSNVTDTVAKDTALDHYVITTGTSQTVGVGWSATVTAQDASNATVSSDSSTVVTMTENGNALFYTDGNYNTTTTTYTLSGGTATIFVKDNVSESITLTATDGNSKTGNSSSITVGSGGIESYTISVTTTQTAGVGFSATVTAKDALNNTVTSDSSTIVTMTENGSAVTFHTSAAYTTTTTTYTLSNGVATIYVKDIVAESLTLTATDSNSKTGNSSSITINPAAIASYAISSDTSQIVDVGWSATVAAKDQFNNTVTTDSSTEVTMTENGNALFYTNDGYSVTTTTYTLSNGTATIYVKDAVTESVTLTATDGNSKTGSSSSISVGAGTATVSYSPDRAVRDADTLTITATFTVSRGSAPQVSINYAGAGSDVSNQNMSGSGTTWTYAANIPSGNDGTATVTIANTTITSGGTFTVDNTSPTLSTATMSSNNSDTTVAKAGNIVTLTITSSENINTPTVTIADHAAGVSGSDTSWSATYTMAAGDTEGAVSFSIGYSDIAGNSATCTVVTSGSAVTYDKTPPAPTVSITNTYYTDSTWVNASTIAGTATDASEVSSVEISIKKNAYTNTYWTGSAWITSETWLAATGTTSWTYTLSNDNLEDGYTYVITARATDSAGNITASGSYSTDQFTYTPVMEMDLKVFRNNWWQYYNLATDTIVSEEVFKAVVSLRDNLWYEVSGYTGTVGFTSSDSHASVSLPDNYAFNSNTHTFTDIVLITAGTRTITVTDINDNNLTVTNNLKIGHGAANHLEFSSDITSPQTAGTMFDLPQLQVVDEYGNVCNGSNYNYAYDYYNTYPDPYTSGSYVTVTYTLSGQANGPDGTADVFYSPVYFYQGLSTGSWYGGTWAPNIRAQLHRAQDTTITAGLSALSGTDTPSNTITVNAGAVAQLIFTQQPSATCTTTQNLDTQPQVSVADAYNNAISGASATVTLSASLSSGAPVGGSGTLSADNLNVDADSSGVAIFSGVTYDYPQAIYLRATSGALSSYSSAIAFSVETNTSVAAGTLSEPSTVSSLADSAGTKVNVFDFKFTDAGLDGFGTKLTQVVINQSGSDTAGDWSTYIGGAYLTDGTTQVTGTINADNIQFGDDTSVIYTVADGGNKTFTLSLFLLETLPAAGDNKVLGFSIDGDADVSVDSLSSQFTATDALTTAPTVDIDSTKFIITGTDTMATGDSNTITIKAVDANGNTDVDYTGNKTIVFSGANTATDGTTDPSCSSSADADIDFGTDTTVAFTDGVATSTMKLYKVETAVIKATDSTLNTATADALSVDVTIGAPAKLLWDTGPHTTIVANAPWREFTVKITDAFENATTSTADVTITPTGGTRGSGATYTVAAVAGTATFSNFTVECASYPGTVTIVASSTGLTSTEASSSVTVAEKYSITVNAQDYTTGAHLTDVSYTISGTADLTGADVNSPISLSLSYGEYSLTFTKAAYMEATQDRIVGIAEDAVDGTYDNSITWNVTITSLAEATADYEIKNGFVYDQETDMLTIRVWLERRGILITNDSFNKLGAANVEIYGNSRMPPIVTTAIDAPDADDVTTGVYYAELENVTDTDGDYQLTGGQSYYVKCIVNYGGADGSGRAYQSGSILHISISRVVRDLTDQIRSEVLGVKSDIVSSEAAIRSDLVARTQAVTAKVTEEATSIKTSQAAAVAAGVTEVTTETDKILTATGDVSDKITTTEATLTTQIEDVETEVSTQVSTNVKPHLKSGILNRKSSLKRGATLTIGYRTTTGLSPAIDVYSPENVKLIDSLAMTEMGTTGVYEYDVKFESSWGTGDFSVVCSESTKGTADATTITVLEQDIEDIGRTASAIMGSTSRLSGLSGITGSITALNSQISMIESSLGSVTKAMSKQVGEVTSTVANLETVFSQLTALSDQVKQLGATEEISLEKVYEVSKEKKEDIVYLKNKTEELKAAMELSQKMIDNVANKPVTQVWFEFKE
jgi:DNA-binding protein Fis